MNVLQYTTKKERDLIRFYKIADHCYYEMTQFDGETGDALPPVVQRIEVSEITKRIAELEEELDQLKLMKTDVTNAPTVNP